MIPTLGSLPRWAWALVGLVFLVALGLGLRVGDGLVAAFSAALCAALLFLPWLALGIPRTRESLPRPGLLSPLASLLFLIVYLLYWAGTGGGTLRGLAILAAYLLIGSLLALPVRSPGSFFIPAAALALWLPFDLNWQGERPLAGIWRWPNGELGYPASSLVATLAALTYFQWSRPIGLGYDWKLDRRKALLSLKLLLLLAVFLVPLGQTTDFLAFGLSETFSRPPILRAFVEPVATALLIFVFIAVPEELLFRGILQGWLQERWRGWAGRAAALGVAALVFGAAHLNNTAGIYRPPNFAYAGMATLAGVAYGYAWMRGGILAAALLHASVDWLWHFFLAGVPTG